MDPGPLERTYDGAVHPLPAANLPGRGPRLSHEPHWAMYLLDEPLHITGQSYDCIGVKHYCYDPSLTPPGKSADCHHAAHRLPLLAAHLRP